MNTNEFKEAVTKVIVKNRQDAETTAQQIDNMIDNYRDQGFTLEFAMKHCTALIDDQLTAADVRLNELIDTMYNDNQQKELEDVNETA